MKRKKREKKRIQSVPFSVNRINIGLDLVDPSDDTLADIPADLPHTLGKFASVVPPGRLAGSPFDTHSGSCSDSHCTRAHNCLATGNLVEPLDRPVGKLVDTLDFDTPVGFDRWAGKQVVLALGIYFRSTLAEIPVRSAPHFDRKWVDTLVHIAAVAAQLRAHSYREWEMPALGYTDWVTLDGLPMPDYFAHRFDKRNSHQSNLETFEALNNQLNGKFTQANIRK